MRSIGICLFLLCLAQHNVIAEEKTNANAMVIEENSKMQDSPSTEKEYLPEIIIRPISVVSSASGLALFIIASPISGLASIPEPHDAFTTTWNDFVLTPYHFAFRRPLGDYSVELYD